MTQGTKSSLRPNSRQCEEIRCLATLAYRHGMQAHHTIAKKGLLTPHGHFSGIYTLIITSRSSTGARPKKTGRSMLHRPSIWYLTRTITLRGLNITSVGTTVHTIELWHKSELQRGSAGFLTTLKNPLPNGWLLRSHGEQPQGSKICK